MSLHFALFWWWRWQQQQQVDGYQRYDQLAALFISLSLALRHSVRTSFFLSSFNVDSLYQAKCLKQKAAHFVYSIAISLWLQLSTNMTIGIIMAKFVVFCAFCIGVFVRSVCLYVCLSVCPTLCTSVPFHFQSNRN